MPRKVICIFLIFTMIISFTFTGCSKEVQIDDEDYEFYEDNDFEDDEEYEDNAESEALEEANQASNVQTPINNLELEEYRLPGIFTMVKPKGWNVYKAGEHNTIAFLTRDDNEPLRQVFCFSEIGLFYVDENQKNIEINYQNSGGYPVQWIDMPVVYPFDGTTFYKKFDAIMESQIAKSFLAAGRMPKPAGFEQIEIISEQAIEPIYPGIPSVLVRALLVQNGKTAQGMFVVSGVTDGFGHATALVVAGITAPLNEYQSAQTSLLEVIKSFTLDASYVQQGLRVIQQNGERLSQISKTLSETSDIITKGWAARNKSDDVRMQKKSDQILGVERVYDPDTDTVYEVKNGFYDYYSTHENEYNKKNLQPLPDNGYNLWDKAPIINHDLVSP